MHRSASWHVVMLLSVVSLTCADQAPNQPPTAAITRPGRDTTVTLHMVVDFEGSCADADGVVRSHAWEFGDGGTAAVEDPAPHRFDTQGVYAVTYQVTDDGGATSAPDTVLVTAVPGPTALIQAPGQDTTVTLGTSVNFQGSAHDADGAVVSHVWDFGDGGTASVEDPGPYRYAARGVYVITYQVTNDAGVTSLADSVTVTINEPPVARIDMPGRDTTSRWPYALEFRGTAHDQEGDITGHHWDFGDGNVADEEDPGPYAFVAAGTYSVTYEVTDENGAVSVPDTVVVTVVETGISPEPGDWFGWPAFGLGFSVGPAGNVVTDVTFVFERWVCGEDSLTIRVTAAPAAGWPIADAAFAITATFPDVNLTITLQGTFTSHAHASGTWTAVWSGSTCTGSWQAHRDAPTIAVFVPPDFSRANGILGFNWLPGRWVTIEIDRGSDGTIDLLTTTRAGYDGTARLVTGGAPLPFDVVEGDSIAMHDAVWGIGYVVRYATLDSVNVATDVVSGRARAGTALRVTIANPVAYVEGPYLETAPDATGRWRADFSGIYDIVAETALGVSARCLGVTGGWRCGGWTAIQWPP